MRGFEVATFRTKTLKFSRAIHLNWLAKIELREGGWDPWPSILLLITVVKMLKETEAEQTINFLLLIVCVLYGLKVIQRLQVRFLQEDNFFALLAFKYFRRSGDSSLGFRADSL